VHGYPPHARPLGNDRSRRQSSDATLERALSDGKSAASDSGTA
jgi:hypothetical protein